MPSGFFPYSADNKTRFICGDCGACRCISCQAMDDSCRVCGSSDIVEQRRDENNVWQDNPLDIAEPLDTDEEEIDHADEA